MCMDNKQKAAHWPAGSKTTLAHKKTKAAARKELLILLIRTRVVEEGKGKCTTINTARSPPLRATSRKALA